MLATLDGATLKLSYPKNNIPRRATFAEEILDATFIGHRCYDMTDAKVTAELPLGLGGSPLAGTPSASRPLSVLQVFLCPPCLARKRLWNKKYPICILFPDRADTEHRSSDEHGTELQGDEGTKKPQVPIQDVPGDCRERCLYLFGRTGREKEEWYQHLLRACHGTPSSSRGEARPGEMRPLLRTRTEPGLGAAPLQEDRLWVGSGERGGGAGTGLTSLEFVQQQGEPGGSPFSGRGWAARHRACIVAGHHVTPRRSQPGHVPVSPGMGPAPQSAASSSGGSTEDIPSAVRPKDLAGNVRQKIFLDYSTYMARFVPAEAGGSPEQSPPHSVLSSPVPVKVSGADPALGADQAEQRP